MSRPPSKQACPDPILAFAITAFALISLFWAIVLVFVLREGGSDLVRIAAEAKKEPFPWVAVASAVIAFGALVVSAGSLYFTRKHQRLSVKPQLEIVLSSGPVAVGSRTHTKREICLRNYGLGPARVMNYCFDFGADGIARNTVELHTILTTKLNFPGSLLGTYFLSLLPVESTERIFWIEPPPNVPTEYQVNLSFTELRKSLRLTVTYESMYGEVFTVSETFVA